MCMHLYTCLYARIALIVLGSISIRSRCMCVGGYVIVCVCERGICEYVYVCLCVNVYVCVHACT